MSTSRRRIARVLRHGFAARCPACGRGRVFAHGVETEAACGVCGWRFERCPGHWVGGNEINVLATFPAGIAAYAVAVLAFGAGALALGLATAATVAFSLAFYRSSRGLYFALDYLIDPSADPAPPPSAEHDDDDDDGGGRGGRDGPRRGPRERPDADHRCGAAPAPASAASAASPAGPRASESFKPRRAPPYPPPAPVSP
jgi:uncharacterized protein (DUF983 family)